MQFDNSYLQLGERFFVKTQSKPVSNPKLLLWNDSLDEQLGLSELQESKRAQYFSGNELLEGSEPIALAYAGHQFGHYNPQLGDGRAHLLGELIDSDGTRKDIQLKGSGATPFSRGGDGLCAIGPALREYLMSEAMFALGVPTTRCLSVVLTGEPVYRQRVHQGAIVTRIASSHIRVGTFQFIAAQQDKATLQSLCDYVINRHFPEVQQTDGDSICALFEAIMNKQIELIVEWLRVGFIHGVMNTDNTAISGETIDFGPCAMLGTYDPETVYSSIDRRGRYAFGNQAKIAHWNMAKLAESLLVLDNEVSRLEPLQHALNQFQSKFEQAYFAMMSNKLGLLETQEQDNTLIEKITQAMYQQQLDYTQTFTLLTRSLNCEESEQKISKSLGDAYSTWYQRLKASNHSLEDIQAHMRQVNPVVIPRNHQVEQVLAEYEDNNNIEPLLAFLNVLKQPYTDSEVSKVYQQADSEYDAQYQTFCGT
ncbi:protein adenylyltransferase SelO [Parashewanella tropica]|uniref:protein adenylyltransferase SelO n=1 Tax=Parashewanella tropica TaxID=2547970 RepID=UPI001059609D|nr:YdiU family protein [Parashewanella tropica]